MPFEKKRSTTMMIIIVKKAYIGITFLSIKQKNNNKLPYRIFFYSYIIVFYEKQHHLTLINIMTDTLCVTSPQMGMEQKKCSEELNVPLIIKKLNIKNRANELAYEDRLYMLQILKQHLPVTKIIEHADGCRINLDNLTDEIINKIHHIINMKLKISHTNKI